MANLSVTAVFRTVEEALATGQAGVPVSARMQWSAGSASEAPAVAFRLLVRLAELLGSSPRRIMVQQHQAGRVLNILATLAGGQTVSLSVHGSNSGESAPGGEPCRVADLLVVGNHGVIRLDGLAADYGPLEAADLITPATAGSPDSAAALDAVECAVRQSLQSGKAVELS